MPAGEDGMALGGDGLHRSYPRKKGQESVNTRDIRMLCEYNRWANARILAAAAPISNAQFLTPGDFPHGGLRGTLVHTLFAELAWRMRWEGSASTFRLTPENFPTFASLTTRWREEEILLMEFVAGLSDERLNAEFDYTSTEGGQHRRVLWEAMAHMVNHGTQHRSEAAAMLTGMGHSPGDIDLIVYLNEAPRSV
jgi:uncharacterized damage-inducible protein DinB